MNLRSAAFGFAFSLLLGGVSLFAHHAGSTYDNEHLVTVSGAVTQYDLVNPHTMIRFDVKDAEGNVVSWTALSGPPQRLYRAGWRANTLKLGDQITVTGAPSKDGRKYMGVKKLVGPAGQVLSEGAE